MTKTSQTIQIAENAAESLKIAFDGVPSESIALQWLRGYWSMNVEMNHNDRLFDGFEDFCASVALCL